MTQLHVFKRSVLDHVDEMTSDRPTSTHSFESIHLVSSGGYTTIYSPGDVHVQAQYHPVNQETSFRSSMDNIFNHGVNPMSSSTYLQP